MRKRALLTSFSLCILVALTWPATAWAQAGGSGNTPPPGQVNGSDDPWTPGPVGTDEGWKLEFEHYERFSRRPALFLRTRSMERFARTADERAFKLLMERYLDPEKPEDHVPYLIAGITADNFTKADHMALWQEFMLRANKPVDAWLWWNALMVQGQAFGGGVARGTATNKKLPVFLRAAALESLSWRNDGDTALQLIPLVLESPDPKAKKEKGLARAVLVESCSSALIAARGRIGEEAFARAANLVIDQLDDKKLPFRTTVTLARNLAETFGTDQLYVTSDSWRKLLEGRNDEARAGAGGDDDPEASGMTTRERVTVTNDAGFTVPRFMGIEGAGTRIAFVIDMSDSMTAPLTSEEKEDLRRPVTGPGAAEEKARRRADDGGPKGAPTEAELPWDKINTRFDAARETLKLSLRQLGDKMNFVVIVFGSKAHPIFPNQGMVPATKSNVAKVINELDNWVVGKPKSDRPNGTLKGYTNLHGGLLEAFRATGKKPLEVHEHVETRGFLEGCDTIFLLSDGEPSWDNFAQVDAKEPDIQIGDPESHTPGQDADNVEYQGPYGWGFYPYLVRDIQRMNLFRKAQIHCIGIGESNDRLLEQIVEVGRGKFRKIGG